MLYSVGTLDAVSNLLLQPRHTPNTMDVTTHHIVVPKTARYYILGDINAVTRDIWIVCHGYSQLAGRFLESFRGVAAPGRVIIAPEALSRFYVGAELPHTAASKVGATWMTREDRDAEIGDIVSYLDAVYEAVLKELGTYGVNRDQVRINALGFSQGGASVSRWVARGNAHVDRLVVWGSSLPNDVNLRGLAERWPDFSVDLVYGSSDLAMGPNNSDAQRAMLEGANVAARLVEFEGGHVVDSATLVRVFEGLHRIEE